MNTKLPYKYNKLAVALLMLSPIGLANAATPVFIENSVLNSELEFLFNSQEGNIGYISLAVDSNNNVFTSYQNAIAAANLVKVANYSQGQLTDLGEQSSIATTQTHSQLRVSANDDSLVLAYVEDGNLVVKTSVDGSVWVVAATTPLTTPLKAMKMELDSQGTPYILHTGTDNKTNVLKLVGSALVSVFGVFDTHSNKSTVVTADIAINSEDRVYLAFRKPSGDNQYATIVSYIDNADQVQTLVTSGNSTPAYLRLKFDNNDNLHLFNVAYGTTGAGGTVYKLDGTDAADTTWATVGNSNIGNVLSDKGADGSLGSEELDLAFNSQNIPYIAYKQMNNTVSTKQQAQVATLINNVWTEVEYDLAAGGLNGADLDKANHSFINIEIDNFDRLLLSYRAGGGSHNAYPYTLRANILTSNKTVTFSVDEGELLVGKLTADDADGDDITLALSGADADLFSIEQTTGQVSFKAVQAIASVDLIYNVTVSATANGDTTSQDIEITLVNDPSNDIPDTPDTDTDGDGIKDDVDTDDDNDGYSDLDEIDAGSDPLNELDTPLDTDGDFIPDVNDPDDDNDTILDTVEAGMCTSSILADTDGDGANDNEEIAAGTDPCVADTDSDNDGVTDYNEGIDGTDPNNPDSDDDGLSDGEEKSFGSNPNKVDSDDDGLADNIEFELMTNPNLSDSDNDGINDIDEIVLADDGTITFITDPNDSDSDDDGLTDGQEATFGSDPNDSDSDDDGLTDAQEATLQTNPNSADSDNDGLTDAEEVALQTNPNNPDSDNDGLNDAIDTACPLQAGDCTAPTFPEEDFLITFDATDSLSHITGEMVSEKVLTLNIEVSDILDDNVSITADHISFSDDNVSAGQHDNLITLSVTDSEGLTATKLVKLNINPVVKIQSKLAVEPGQTEVAIPIRVLGDIPAESTVINYSIVDVLGTQTFGSIAVNANEPMSEEDASNDYSQVVDSLLINIPEDAQHNSEIIVTLLASDHVNVLANSQSVIRIIDENKAPQLSLSIEQERTPENGDYQLVSLIQPAFGLVKVTAVVDDINIDDTHNINFTVSYNGEDLSNIVVDFPEEEEDQPNTFIFDATDLDPLDYTITATVTENNTNDSYTASANAVLPVNLIYAGDAVYIDTDNDGIADSEEQPGFENDDSRIHFAAGADNIMLENNSTGSGAMLVAEGLSIKLGHYALAKQQRQADGWIITNTLVKTPNLPLDENGDVSVEGNVDINFTSVTPVTNFIIGGLPLEGDSAAVVMPLLSVTKTEQLDENGDPVMNEDIVLFKNVVEDISIPDGAVYRKYTPENGWFNFVENAKNSIGSAMKDEFGNCPVAYSIDYNINGEAEADANGLVTGNQCIQLIIEDGGANDADGLVNGRIEDPGFLATQNANMAPSLETLIPVSAVSGESVSIAAIGSDANGDALTYQWFEITVENGVQVATSIPNADTAILSITAPTVTDTQVFTYAVTAVDPSGDNSTQELVELTVTSAVEDKPDADLNRDAGSFAWLLALTGLIGLRRRKRLN